MWYPFKVYRDLGRSEGELAVLRAENARLVDKIEQLESEKKDLLDWFFTLNGAPPLYGRKSAARVENEETYASRVEENERIPKNPFAGATKSRDFQRVADQLEAEAFGSPLE